MIKVLSSNDRKRLRDNTIAEIKQNPERYKYYCWNIKSYEDLKKDIETDRFLVNEFVSISENIINGFFGYVYDVINEKITGIYLLCFEDNNYTFMRDFKKFIEIIDKTYNRIEIEIIPGSPSYKLGVKFFKKFNFKKVGIKEKSIKLLDNKFYDLEIYQRCRG